MSSVADIRRGTVAEAPHAASAMREAARWLIERGDKLWDLSELSDAEAVANAARGELVVGYEGSTLVACMYFQGEDAEAWPQAIPGEAFYVHKLAVRRAYAGRGWSQRLLAWAGEEARRLGRPFLRLDSELRPPVLALYERAGFVRIDREPISVQGYRVVRFEQSL